MNCAICGTPVGFMAGGNYQGEKICSSCNAKMDMMKDDTRGNIKMKNIQYFRQCLNDGKVSPSIQPLIRKLCTEEEQNTSVQMRTVPCMTTTGLSFEGYEVETYFKVVTSEVVLGTGFISELSASISDFMGNTDNAMEEKLSQAKETALEKLKLKAVNLGGNALIAIDFDLMTLGMNMIVASASGTAVKIVRKQ